MQFFIRLFLHEVFYDISNPKEFAKPFLPSTQIRQRNSDFDIFKKYKHISIFKIEKMN